MSFCLFFPVLVEQVGRVKLSDPFENWDLTENWYLEIENYLSALLEVNSKGNFFYLLPVTYSCHEIAPAGQELIAVWTSSSLAPSGLVTPALPSSPRVNTPAHIAAHVPQPMHFSLSI